MNFPGRLGVQQRVLPSYRAALFDLLSQSCQGGLCLFAGLALPVEGITPARGLQSAHYTLAHNHHFLDPGSPFYLCWQSDFIRWLDTCQPEALIVEANPRYPSTRLAIRWMRERGRRVLGWGLGAPALSGALAGMRASERFGFLGSLDGVIAYSRRGAQEYLSLGLSPERVFVASNAVDARPRTPPPERMSVISGQPVVLFIGRLQERKRVDQLFKACAALPGAIQPRVIIVGDGPAKSSLEALAREIYPQVEFTGARHGAELEPYFAAADLFVLPGTGGLAVQQAMAHGLPVIVAQGDGTQEDLVRPANGWQIPADDPEALQAVLSDALSDVTRLRRMGAESYRIVMEEVNLETMVAAFMSALDQVFHLPALTTVKGR